MIRQEKQEDHDEVYHLVKEAFASAKYSDGKEQDLVAALRKSKSFIVMPHFIVPPDCKFAAF